MKIIRRLWKYLMLKTENFKEFGHQNIFLVKLYLMIVNKNIRRAVSQIHFYLDIHLKI